MRTERLKLRCVIDKDGNLLIRRVWLDSAYDWLALKSEPDNYTVHFVMNEKAYHVRGTEFLAIFRQARTTALPTCNCQYRGFAIWEHEAHCQRRRATGL